MNAHELLLQAETLAPGEAARAYAEFGLRVFPCAPDAKRPITAHGFHDATTNPNQIDAWWAEHPDANVGLATGTLELDRGFDVLDIDVRVGGHGFTGFEHARRAGLVDGWAALVRTPSGGVHAYYPTDLERPQGCWTLPEEHVDFRGVGGYVLVPPSTIDRDDRRGYRVIGHASGAPRSIDANAVHDLLAAQSHRRALASRPRQASTSIDLERLGGWVATRAEGSRNASLYWAACRCAEAGLDHLTVHERLGNAARTAGLSARETTATIRSAYRSTPSTLAPARQPSRKEIDVPRGGMQL